MVSVTHAQTAISNTLADLTSHRHDGALLTTQTALALGRQQRQLVPHSKLAALPPRPADFDILDFIDQIDANRLPHLLPLRHQRMAASAFTFFRGLPALMAYDLSHQLHTGLLQQICGDCHLLNFGGFASPERNLLFGLNDFDETLVGPFEWDLKRLVASIAIAVQVNRWPVSQIEAWVTLFMQQYLVGLQSLHDASPIEVWYDREDETSILQSIRSRQVRSQWIKAFEKGRRSNSASLIPKLTEKIGKTGKRRFINRFPDCFKPDETDPIAQNLDSFFDNYRQSLSADRQILLDRYALTDMAMRVVGVGSVGTRCGILLLEDGDHEPLILQFKQAWRPALPDLLQRSPQHDGERIVLGQKLLQPASDLFLGWSTDVAGNTYFVRQLRDMKVSTDLEDMDLAYFETYLRSCGSALAHAHAKAGMGEALLGYLGKSDSMARALGQFALAYADRNAHDYAAYMQAMQAGRYPLPM